MPFRRLGIEGGDAEQQLLLPVPHVDTLAVAHFLAQDFDCSALAKLFSASAPADAGYSGTLILSEQLAQAREASVRLFDAPPLAVSASMTASRASLMSESVEHAGWSFQCTAAGTEFGCCLACAGGQRFLVLSRRPLNAATHAIGMLQPPAGQRVVDACFYRDAQLAVLVQAPDSARLDIVDCETVPFQDIAPGGSFVDGAHTLCPCAYR